MREMEKGALLQHNVLTLPMLVGAASIFLSRFIVSIKEENIAT